MGNLHRFQDAFVSGWKDWTASHISLFLVGIALAAWIAREIHIWAFHLRGVPGPFWNSVSCNWILFRKGYSATLYQWETQLSQKHGRLVRVGPNHVLTDDPEVLRRISAVRSPYVKSDWYVTARFVPGVDNTITMGRRGQKDMHLSRRAMLVATYNGKENVSPSFSEVMDSCITELIGLLDRKYVFTPPGPLVPCKFEIIAQFFALDQASSLIWSEPFGFLAQDADIGGYLQMLENFTPIRAALGTLSFFTQMVPLLEYLLPTPGDKSGLGRLMGIARNALDDRLRQVELGGENIKKDMLMSFIDKGLTGEALRGELFMIMVGASDSPTGALRMAVSLLVSHPLAYQRLNVEIAAGVADGTISSPVVQDGEARAMPYLQAVLRETLRLFPVPAEAFKEVPPEGDVIAGHRLPAGTWVGWNLRSMFRRKDIWGDDAELFRPERWLEAAAADKDEGGGERFRYLAGLIDMAFGSGRFQCPGKLLAWTMLEKTIVELLRNFDFAPVNPAQPIKFEIYLNYLIREQRYVVTRKQQS